MDLSIPELEAGLAAFADRPADAANPERLDYLNQLAWEIALQDPARSRVLCKEALALSRRVNHTAGIASALRTMAYGALLRTRLKRAIDLSNRSREIFAELGPAHEYGYATATDVASNCYNFVGSYDRALELAIEYNEVARRIGFTRGEGWSLYNLGQIYVSIGDLIQGRDSFTASYNHFTEMGYDTGRSRVLMMLAGVLDRLGDSATAREQMELSYSIASEMGTPLLMASTLAELGRLHIAEGNSAEARECYRRCLEINSQTPNKSIIADTQLNLGQLAVQQGDYASAMQSFESALVTLKKSNAPPLLGRIHQAMSEACAATGEYRQAYHHAREAQSINEQVRIRESDVKLSTLQIRLKVESAEKEAELNRLRYEEKAAAEARLTETLNVLSEDLELARRVQRSLLPDLARDTGEFDVAVYFEPMIQIGGDIYDLYAIRPGCLRIFLADATGHGVQAALTTMVIKTEYERLRTEPLSLAELLGELNRSYCGRFASLGAFFSCAIIEVDLAAGELRAASGGHPEQLLYSQTEGALETLTTRGAMMGAFPGSRFSELRRPVGPGDCLVMFSDGIEEARNLAGDFYTSERMLQSIEQVCQDATNSAASTKSADSIVSAIMADVHQFRESADARDDLSLIVARIPGP